MPTTPPPPPSTPVPGPPRGRRTAGDPAPSADRHRTVVALSAVSILLAVALVVMSVAWWRARDAGAADAPDSPPAEDGVPGPTPTTEGAGPADRADPVEPDGRHGDGGEPAVPPAPAPAPVPGDGDGPAADDPTGDLLDELGRVFDDLLGGDLGDLGGLGEAGELGSLSPECLGGGVDDLFGSLFDPEALSGTLDEQVREIADRVQAQRQLRFVQPVDPVLLHADEFDQRIADMVAAEYPARTADLDARILTLLGALPANTDLLALQADLLAGQVAGFYDPDTGEIVVRDDGDGALDTSEQLTLAHELDHALTDQALGLPDISSDADSDGNLAAAALVEGDATLLMQQYALARVGLLDQLGQLADPTMRAAQDELERVPPYLRQEMMFPYLTGLEYACRLHADGGWSAVDDAYEALPSTTAEVMFADRAGTAPIDPDDPGRPPAPWTVARRDTIGAAQLSWLLGAPGGDEDEALPGADELAGSWAGGELVLATRGADSALGVALVDRASDGTLCAAIDEWYGRSFDDDDRRATGDEITFEGSTQTAVLRCSGDDVRFGIAPDRSTAAAVAD
jgi:hypothetical protein